MEHTIKQKAGGGWRNNYFLKAFFPGPGGCPSSSSCPFWWWTGDGSSFYGDFNVQQVPFYRLAHDMAGETASSAWSQHTDLGANFIGSYSFYLLGSPFFWLTIPFPSEWLQFLMGAPAHSEIRLRHPDRVRVPAPVHQDQGHRPFGRGAVRLLRVLHLQRVFQPLPRGHCVLPPAAGRFGRVHGRPAAGAVRPGGVSSAAW